MTDLAASLRIPVGLDDSSDFSLSLELDRIIPQIGKPIGTAILRLYPSVPAEIFASRGDANLSNISSERIEEELVTFSASNVSNTARVMSGFVQVKKDWAFDLETGKRISGIRFTPVEGTTRIEASKNFTGVILVSYVASYREVIFDFEVTPVGKTTAHSLYGVIEVSPGTVLAYYEGATAQLEVTPPAFSDTESTQYTEVYKIVSYTVVNSKGVWERPTDWPDKNDYENNLGTGPDIGEPSIEVERVHEIGLVDGFGRFRSRTYYAPVRQPFDGVSSYTPPYEFVSSYTAKDPEDSTCAVNYESILPRLQKVYGFSDEDISSFGCYTT